MRYYLCILGNFPEVDDIYNDCINKGIYQYHKSTRQKGAVDSVEEGSKLILVYRKQLRAYAVAGKGQSQGVDKDWVAIGTRNGWQGVISINGPQLPWGVYWHTLEGNKQSIVKELDSEWASRLILMIKNHGQQSSDDVSFPVFLDELAAGFKEQQYFSIPAVQRGLVWDSVRCEVLWDSILRGIPIGALSLKRNDIGKWEIFDGQQRANAIMLGYSDYNSKESKKILWIDLEPDQAEMSSDNDPDNHRKFAFRLTTTAHPWGYTLSKNETRTTCLTATEQREAVENLDGKWERYGKKGARPYPVELWPFTAKLPVPFGALRKYVSRLMRNEVPSFANFIKTCGSECGKRNWFQNVRKWMGEHEGETPGGWEGICEAVRSLDNYTIPALNCKGVADSDIGLYFKRLNKQGIVPGQEDINYSLLKSKIHAVKELDEYECRRTAPSRLAHVAMRFWLSRKDGWKSIKGVDVDEVIGDKGAFERFVKLGICGENGLEELMCRLEAKLTEGENGLMPLHLQFIYNAGDGELAVLLLRYCQENAEMDSGLLRAIATTLAWFSSDMPAAVRAFWKSSSPQEGVLRAFSENSLIRVPSPQEIDEFVQDCNGILQKDNEKAWADVLARRRESPYVADALNAVWSGFRDGNGCPLLLYGCRRFIREWFADYDPCSPEWGEQNRPWDYDHIAPQDWFRGNQMKQDWRLPLCKVARESIGNSAPLPFSLNRARKDAPPGANYPTGSNDGNAKRLLLEEGDVRQYAGSKYEKVHRKGKMAVHIVCTTLNRVAALYRNWYEGCEIGKLFDYAKIADGRRLQVESIRMKIEELVPGTECYFIRDPYQHAIQSDWDWAREWISCGTSGTVMVEGKRVKCLFGIAVGPDEDGLVWEWGARRHPSEHETNVPSGWWVAVDDEEYIYNCSKDVLDEDACIRDLKNWMERYQFEIQ